jgi:hypothetical protein
MRVIQRVSSDANLLQSVLALRSPRSSPSGLHGRQEQRNQHSDDGDDDQEFHQSER